MVNLNHHVDQERSVRSFFPSPPNLRAKCRPRHFAISCHWVQGSPLPKEEGNPSRVSHFINFRLLIFASDGLRCSRGLLSGLGRRLFPSALACSRLPVRLMLRSV